jgi:hypothetical protein
LLVLLLLPAAAVAAAPRSCREMRFFVCTRPTNTTPTPPQHHPTINATPTTKQERQFVSKYVESEIVNHSLLRHPHVVCFREAFLSRGHINMCATGGRGGWSGGRRA